MHTWLARLSSSFCTASTLPTSCCCNDSAGCVGGACCGAGCGPIGTDRACASVGKLAQRERENSPALLHQQPAAVSSPGHYQRSQNRGPVNMACGIGKRRRRLRVTCRTGIGWGLMGCCRCGDNRGGCCVVAPGAASAGGLGGGNDGSNRSRTCADDCCCRCWGATPGGVPAAPDGGKDGFHAAAAGPLCPPACALAVGPGCWDCLARLRPASVALTWSCRRGKWLRSAEVGTESRWRS